MRFVYADYSDHLIALVVYEHLITFQQEIETVWRGKIGAVAILLVSTRLNLLLSAMTSFSWQTNSASVCTITNRTKTAN